MDNRDQLGKREITCFKAYDVRGELGKNLDADVAYRIGRAFAQARGAKRVVVGRDSRESSPELAAALIEGLTDGGADVLDLGLAGTEEVYFHTGNQDTDGGIEVTASHNPINYKRHEDRGSRFGAAGPATELPPIVDLATNGEFAPPPRAASPISAMPAPNTHRAWPISSTWPRCAR